MRKFNHKNKTQLVWIFPFLAIIALIALVLPALGNSQPDAITGIEGTPVFLPLMKVDLTPTPTPTATPVPIPQFVSNMPLANAKCPGTAAFNPISGYIYITNDYSSNVNVFQDRNLIHTIHIPPTLPDSPVGAWPVAIAADVNSTEVYVAAVHGGVARINGLNLISMGERYYEPHGAAINPVNGLIYVPDLDRAMQVFDGSTLVTNIVFDMDPLWDAWFLDAVVDPNTGYVYTAGAEGMMYVVNGTDVIGSYRLGFRVIDLEIDPIRGYIYAAHGGKNETYQNNISVFNIHTQTVTQLNTATDSRNVAVDLNSGIAYITNPGPDDHPGNDSVTILTGTTVYGNMLVGNKPWGVAVNPNNGHAFITNRGDGTVTVARNGIYVATIPVQGQDPFAIAVDTHTNDIYVANRGREFDPFGSCDNASVTILR